MLGFTERRDIMRNYFKALLGIILALVIGTINGTEVVFIMVAMFIGIPSLAAYLNEMFK